MYMPSDVIQSLLTISSQYFSQIEQVSIKVPLFDPDNYLMKMNWLVAAGHTQKS